MSGSKVNSITVRGAYRYLGTWATLGEGRSKACDKLRDGLSNLSRAPLKPQQRLFILRTQLLPSLYHELVLGDKVTGQGLRSLDREVRRTVRRWLRLPHDSPNSLFYAKDVVGGLGLDELACVVPLLRRRRPDKLLISAEHIP